MVSAVTPCMNLAAPSGTALTRTATACIRRCLIRRSRITDEDIHALYAYFMNEVKPVDYKPPETKLPFPFNIRWNLFFWDAAFVKNERYKPRNDRDAQWNRGAYLVQSLGHCGTCHTPRGIAFQEKAYTESSPVYLKGAVIDNWFASNLTGRYRFRIRPLV